MNETKCTPHSWKLPVPGDIELECVECGRRLHLHRDITPNMRTAIINSIERHIDSYEFQGFFGYGPLREAFEAARPPVEIPERTEEQKKHPELPTSQGASKTKTSGRITQNAAFNYSETG